MLQHTGLKNYDEYTSSHSANVAVLTIPPGPAGSNDYRFLSALGTGALLHDIGKLSLDQQVLNKEGSLTAEEWAHVRRHPVDGAQMVALMPGVDRSAIVTVLEHHMRYDGTGYPEVDTGRRQRLASRIVAVADSFDAMTSKRTYSAARIQDEAVSQLVQGAGTSLDPVLVRLFVQIVGIYPPRSVVRLTSGDVALVLEPGESDPMRPVVRIIARFDGEFIDPVDLDLAAATDVGVAETIDARLLNIDVDSYFD
jgi:HD-GYP domain-containing protein (c-di-GMP phosphodiesterase class II)